MLPSERVKLIWLLGNRSHSTVLRGVRHTCLDLLKQQNSSSTLSYQQVSKNIGGAAKQAENRASPYKLRTELSGNPDPKRKTDFLSSSLYSKRLKPAISMRYSIKKTGSTEQLAITTPSVGRQMALQSGWSYTW